MNHVAPTTSSHLSQFIRKSDLGAIACHYASQLHLCYPLSPISYSLARTIHAQMLTSGFKPCGRILNRLIDVYCKFRDLSYARYLFEEIPNPDIYARTTLIAGYFDAEDIKGARDLFNRTPLSVRDTVSYNAMITGYSHNGDVFNAIRIFKEMNGYGFKPDTFTFSSISSALALIVNDIRPCEVLHCGIIKLGLESVVCVLNALVALYVRASASSIGSARKLFDQNSRKDELSWTTMITGYVRYGDLDSAFQLFSGMTEKLQVAWNAMISGYVQYGFILEALEMFKKMYFEGLHLDEFTYTSVISGCASSGLFRHGKQVHGYIIRTEAQFGFKSDLPVNNALISLYSKYGKVDHACIIFEKISRKDIVSWNAILTGYINLGRIEDSKIVFDRMPERNVLSWTVMIAGFGHNGFGEEALKLFNSMRMEGFVQCDYAFSAAIIACAGLGALENGRQLHSQLVRLGFDSSLSVGNALMTMYGKCGVVEAAHQMFLTMPCVDSVSWNAMIAAFGQHGNGKRALELFDRMLEENILPDRITFLTILSACSHGGLVKQGCKYFESMDSVYGIKPGEDHYARYIDLLCRAGKISDAKDLIRSMPFEPGVPIWEALLSGSRLHGNMELGIEAAERLFELVPQQDGPYVLLANIYASLERFDDVAKVRMVMRQRNVKKEPGCSWIEVANKVHVFMVDDTNHPEIQEIFSFLMEVGVKMRKLGYVPDTKFALHDIGLEQKEYGLSTHSEKLAVGFGLLKLPRGATVRVLKNLRICGDCHSAFKYMCKVVEREIVVRDGKRFHHFKDGECSCGNYW